MEQVLKRKDIVLVPFSFSDMSGYKQRPALVISGDRFNEVSPDLVLCSITSNIEDSDNLVLIKREDWKDGLYSESGVRVDSIQTVSKKIVIKKIGRLGTERFNVVKKKVIALFE